MRFTCQATYLRLQSCSSGRHGLLLLLLLLLTLLLSLLRLHLLRRLLRLLLRRRRQRHSCKASVMSGHLAAGHAKMRSECEAPIRQKLSNFCVFHCEVLALRCDQPWPSTSI